MLNWRLSARVLAISFVAIVVGCSSQSRPQATQIAESGALVAEAAAKTHQDLIDSTVRSVEGQYLLAGLSGRNPPSTTQIDQIDLLTNSLAARALALHDLARVYRSLGQLAEYDAAGEVEGRLNDLTDSVNSFGTALKPKSYRPISNVDRGLIGRAGGLIAGEVQGARIRAISVPIRERVVVMRDLLRQQQFLYQSLQASNANEQRLLAMALYKNGLGENEPTLRSLLESYGFSPADDQIKLLLERDSPANKAKLQEQLVAIYGFRRGQAIKLQSAILESAVNAMDSLIEQHVQLEASAEISKDQLAAQVTAINTLLADYKRWKEADQAIADAAKTK